MLDTVIWQPLMNPAIDWLILDAAHHSRSEWWTDCYWNSVLTQRHWLTDYPTFTQLVSTPLATQVTNGLSQMEQTNLPTNQLTISTTAQDTVTPFHHSSATFIPWDPNYGYLEQFTVIICTRIVGHCRLFSLFLHKTLCSYFILHCHRNFPLTSPLFTSD